MDHCASCRYWKTADKPPFEVKDPNNWGSCQAVLAGPPVPAIVDSTDPTVAGAYLYTHAEFGCTIWQG